MNNHPTPGDASPPKARLLQVAKTMFFGLLMIGKQSTWEKGGDGARMTPRQLLAGAIIGTVILIVLLLTLVRVMIRLAGG